MKKKTIHDKRLHEDDPSFPHPDSGVWDVRNMARPFAYRNFGTDGRKNAERAPVSGKGYGQALIDWDEQTNFDE
jgi:hypothetical protein